MKELLHHHCGTKNRLHSGLVHDSLKEYSLALTCKILIFTMYNVIKYLSFQLWSWS